MSTFESHPVSLSLHTKEIGLSSCRLETRQLWGNKFPLQLMFAANICRLRQYVFVAIQLGSQHRWTVSSQVMDSRPTTDSDMPLFPSPRDDEQFPMNYFSCGKSVIREFGKCNVLVPSNLISKARQLNIDGDISITYKSGFPEKYFHK